MKKVKKIIIFLVIILMAFAVNCYATDCQNLEKSAKDFKTTGETQLSTNAAGVANSITDNIKPIYSMFYVAGILIVGICFVILGIQWVMAKASPDAQAKLKDKMFALAIAAGVIFGSLQIWKIVVTMLDSIDG